MVDMFFKIFKVLQSFKLLITKRELTYKYLVALWLEQWIATNETLINCHTDGTKYETQAHQGNFAFFSIYFHE